MSSGPLTVYNGTTGVADTGGDCLTGDLNVYFSVSYISILVEQRGSWVIVAVPG